MSSRRVFPSGLPCLKSSSDAPGRPTTLNVGFGMYSEITLRTAILVRPLTSTYLISPEYSGGRNFVKASVVSYMWLSASKTGKSTMGFGMATSVMTGPIRRRFRAADGWFSTSTSILQDNGRRHNRASSAARSRGDSGRRSSMQSFASMLHQDRLLPADPGVRRIARTLYEGTRALPIVSPHGHCDPAAFADDSPVRQPGDRAGDQGPLHPPHALQPGRAARSAGGATARRRAGGHGREADLA